MHEIIFTLGAIRAILEYEHHCTDLMYESVIDSLQYCTLITP